MNEYSIEELFKGYSNYNKEEYNKILESAIIVVDTNILLNFYRYSEETRKELLKVLKDLEKRLWIPYQVIKEYFDNKNKVISEAYNEYTKLEKALNKYIHDAENEVNMKKTTQFKCKEEILNILTTANEKIIEILNNEKLKKKPNFEKNEIEHQIIELFNDSIGKPFEEMEYKKVKEEGERRVQNQIPPGYKDDEKNENGDYYIFYSMIQKAKEANKDMIFITDDVKEDWFNEVNGERHGGRYELLNEFYKETKKLLLIYTSDGFIRLYDSKIKSNKKAVNYDNVINELANVREEMDSEKDIEKINKIRIIRNHIIKNTDKNDIEEALEQIIDLVRNLENKNALIHVLYRLRRHKNKIKMGEEFNHRYIIRDINGILSYYYDDTYLQKDTQVEIRKSIESEFKEFIINLRECEKDEDYKELIDGICDIILKYMKILMGNETNSSLRNKLKFSLEIIEGTKYSNLKLENKKERVLYRIYSILNNIN